MYFFQLFCFTLFFHHLPSSSIIFHHHPSSSIIIHHHPSSIIIHYKRKTLNSHKLDTPAELEALLEASVHHFSRDSEFRIHFFEILTNIFFFRKMQNTNSDRPGTMRTTRRDVVCCWLYQYLIMNIGNFKLRFSLYLP